MTTVGKLMAVFFPRKQEEVTEHLSNVDVKLAPPPAPGKDYAAKYGFDPIKVGRITTLKTQIPAHLLKAQELHESSQAETAAATSKIREASIIVHEFGASMQRHASFDISDYEDLGFRRIHVPPDPALAKVKITNIAHMSNLIRYEWAKEFWAGINIYTSDDGVTFKFTAFDDRSPWEDTRLNKTNAPEVRYYIFRHRDKNGSEIGTETRLEVVAAVYDIEGSRAVPN